MTAKFAPVAPPHILQDMLSQDAKAYFGRYHLWLAHLTCERDGEFRELNQRYYGHRNDNGGYALGPMTIIMDNSVVELGSAQSKEMVAEASALCTQYPSEVIPVLPDVMGNGMETERLLKWHYKEWVAEVPHKGGFMFVAQGEDWEDFIGLVNYVATHRDKYPKVTWVGIPRILTSRLGTRLEALHYVKTVLPDMKVHLLGLSLDIWDDIRCSQQPGVEGIDSAVPLRYPGHLLPTTTEAEIGHRGAWMEEGKFTPAAAKNITNFRRWIRQSDY